MACFTGSKKKQWTHEEGEIAINFQCCQAMAVSEHTSYLTQGSELKFYLLSVST